jgi:hypothetical protein
MRRALLLLALAAVPAAATPGEVVRVEHRDPSALPSRGSRDAPVTIELFFTPGQTSRGAPYRALERLQAQHPTKIRLVYRILAANGQVRLPYAALEAYAEGRFFEFMDRLNSKIARSNPTNGELVEMGVEIGIDPDRLASAMSNPPQGYVAALAANDRRYKQHVHSRTQLPLALFNGRVTQTQLGALGPADLEREYHDAKERAEDLLDRGADPGMLEAALDEQNVPNPQDIVLQPTAADEELDQQPADPPLASPPLRLDGLPAFGPPDAAVQIVVLCSPTSATCRKAMDPATIVQDNFPEGVRVVWAPYYDVSRPDAGELGLLGDAALCAEQVGTSSENELDRPSSPGWRWVEAVLAEASTRHRRVPADQLIDKVAAKLHVDPRAFAACRARLAGRAVAWIEAARHAGVRTTPATVVGGRIYGPIADANALQQLVEVELAPGWLGESAPSWRRRL